MTRKIADDGKINRKYCHIILLWLISVMSSFSFFNYLPILGHIQYSQPKKGSALLFFPAAGGIPNTPLDIRTLHCGEVVAETSETDKWISQLWLRAGSYSPTAPPGNLHEHALSDVKKYCQDASSS